MAEPFLKWAGGKRKLVPEIMKLVPAKFGNYHEPFLGGGALFFHLQEQGLLAKRDVYLSDYNGYLIATYRALRDKPQAVLVRLGVLAFYYDQDGEEFYYEVRKEFSDKHLASVTAAQFIFLNRTCFNGLWRMNRKGEFNVPHGKYANPTIRDSERLLAASKALRDVNSSISCCTFHQTNWRIKRNDLVYLDPPYVPLKPTSNFTSYTADGFGQRDHEELADYAMKLRKRGVHVIVSNSDTPLVRKLYTGWSIKEVRAARAINSKGSGRGEVTELLIYGGK